MPYVQVDVDMDDIDTEDLVEELCKRFKYPSNSRKLVTIEQKKELKESIAPLNLMLQNYIIDSLNIETLEDKMKYEHLVNVWSKYSSSQLEALIP